MYRNSIIILNINLYTIIKVFQNIIFYIKGVEMCSSHIFYLLPFTGHSYEGDHWA